MLRPSSPMLHTHVLMESPSLLHTKKRGWPAKVQQPQKVHIKDVEVDDFHVVRVIADSRLCTPIYYVGRIMAKEPKGYSIQCLRRYNTQSLNLFIYPPEDDICLYLNTDIIKLLTLPKIVRGVHHFPADELLPFSKNLR
jgi:hypothetical protein